MTTIDWVLLGIVAASSVFGLMRGFVGAVVSLIAWALAGWAAFRHGGTVAGVLAGGGELSTGQLLAGYAACFLGVLIVVSLVGWIVRLAMKSAGLSGVDRTLGLALGVVRGGFVACALVLLLGLTSLPREPDWQASTLVPLFVPGAQALRGWLPEWVATQVDLGAGPPLAPSFENATFERPTLELPTPAGA